MSKLEEEREVLLMKLLTRWLLQLKIHRRYDFIWVQKKSMDTNVWVFILNAVKMQN
jgi:hypothetical protein